MDPNYDENAAMEGEFAAEEENNKLIKGMKG
jgi:hypothetical protein